MQRMRMVSVMAATTTMMQPLVTSKRRLDYRHHDECCHEQHESDYYYDSHSTMSECSIDRCRWNCDADDSSAIGRCYDCDDYDYCY